MKDPNDGISERVYEAWLRIWGLAEPGDDLTGPDPCDEYGIDSMEDPEGFTAAVAKDAGIVSKALADGAEARKELLTLRAAVKAWFLLPSGVIEPHGEEQYRFSDDMSIEGIGRTYHDALVAWYRVHLNRQGKS